MKLVSSKLIIFILILLITLQACAEIKSLVSKNPVEPSAPVKESTAETSNQGPLKAANLAKKNIEAGGYQKAIDTYSIECHKKPQDPQLMIEYAKSLDGIKSSADKALEKKDFVYAGRMYYILHNNYAKFSDVGHMLSFDSAYLDTKLSNCKKPLSLQGFEEYRRGDIEKALALWQALLAIDPDNKAIKEAVRTAKLQQKNLKED
jgi:tetratricopeptide (TPR) repeat protein